LFQLLHLLKIVLVWDSESKEAVLIDAGGDAAVLKKK
jgi:hypothetical protein